MPVIPHPFLFRYSFPVPRVERIPRKGRKLLDLPMECRLPHVGETTAAKHFAEVSAAWNDEGLGVSVIVAGKTAPPQSRVDLPTESDGAQFWIDTRNTQSIHRASRFCHHFCVLPTGAGKTKDRPFAMELPIARAREESALSDPKSLKVAVEHYDDGYRLEVWLPGDVLRGYDPAANPRLGFNYLVRDLELGEQHLTVGREFPVAHDPSLWTTLELTDT